MQDKSAMEAALSALIDAMDSRTAKKLPGVKPDDEEEAESPAEADAEAEHPDMEDEEDDSGAPKALLAIIAKKKASKG